MKKIILSGVAFVLIGVSLFFYQSKMRQDAVTPADPIATAMFSCFDTKTVSSIFFEDKAELTLSDGRSMLLLHAISASGARYTNQDETIVFWNKGDTAFLEEKGVVTFKDCVTKKEEEKPAVVGMANPASENCGKVSGKLVINKRGDGGEYGLCYFEENRACEEWALMRGDCPVGGRKTTGYDTIDQNYCAWSGGETFAVKDSVCTFKNGIKCPTLSFYNGTCLSAK